MNRYNIYIYIYTKAVSLHVCVCTEIDCRFLATFGGLRERLVMDNIHCNTRTCRWIGNGINIRRVTKNNPRNGYNGVIYGIPYI